MRFAHSVVPHVHPANSHVACRSLAATSHLVRVSFGGVSARIRRRPARNRRVSSNTVISLVGRARRRAARAESSELCYSATLLPLPASNGRLRMHRRNSPCDPHSDAAGSAAPAVQLAYQSRLWWGGMGPWHSGTIQEFSGKQFRTNNGLAHAVIDNRHCSADGSELHCGWIAFRSLFRVKYGEPRRTTQMALARRFQTRAFRARVDLHSEAGTNHLACA